MKSELLILSLVSILIFSCQPKNQVNHDSHNHDDVKIVFTAYSDNFEVFAEADPFSSGNASSILAHFTWLKNFKALDSASVTAVLKVGTKSLSHKLDSPTRVGIYKFEITPEAEGDAILSFEITTADGIYNIDVPTLKVYSDGHDAIHEALDNEDHEPNAISFTKEQSWKVDFACEFPKYESFGQIIKTSAIVKNAPADEEIIIAKTSGVARFISGNITLGQSISQNQQLFSISGNELAENNSSVKYAESLNNFETAKAEYERHKILAADKIVSEKELSEAKNKFENAQAVFLNLKNNFKPEGQTVKASKGGFITGLYVENGEYVESGRILAKTSRNIDIFLTADIQQKYANIIGLINDATILVPGVNQSYTLSDLNGKIVSYGKSTNSGNHLIPIVIQVKNNGSFVSGSFVELNLKTEGSPTLVIPNSAIMEEQGNYFVFIQHNPEQFVKHNIVVGLSDGINTEVKSGLLITDRVITKGAVFVKLAQSSGELDAHSGHVH